MVCPPPHTHTDLNLILMEVENVNMTEAIRTELKENVYKLFQNFLIDKLKLVMNLIQEDRRNLNWFNGDSRVSLPKKSTDEDYPNFWSYKMVTNTESNISVSPGENLLFQIADMQCTILPNNYNGILSLYAEKSQGTEFYVNDVSTNSRQRHINKTFNCIKKPFELMAKSQLEDHEGVDGGSILKIDLTFSKSCRSSRIIDCMIRVPDPLFSKYVANNNYTRRY